MESAGTAGASILASSSRPRLDDLGTATVDDLRNAAAAAGRSGDGRESAPDDSQPDPLGSFERDRASFSRATVLLALIFASIVVAAITRAVARRYVQDEAFDHDWWVPANRASTDAQTGREQQDRAQADGRTGAAPRHARADAVPPRRVSRDRPSEGTRSRPERRAPTRRGATRRGGPGQRRLGVGGARAAVDGSSRTASRNRAEGLAQIQDHPTFEQPATDDKRQSLDRRWLTRLPVREADR
jgi:hypothetical protein